MIKETVVGRHKAIGQYIFYTYGNVEVECKVLRYEHNYYKCFRIKRKPNELGGYDYIKEIAKYSDWTPLKFKEESSFPAHMWD